MTVTSTMNRRPPPRRNPEPEVAANQAPIKTQVMQVPWVTLVVTTAITTLTGYAVLELIKYGHRAFQRRRQAEADALTASNPKPAQLPAMGMRGDGTFSLPTPAHSFAPAESNVRPFTGFAAPAPAPQAPAQRPNGGHLTDVSTPTGYIEHQVKSMQQQQYEINARMQQLEQLLRQAGPPQPQQRAS